MSLPIVTTVKDANFLLHCNVISIDIETNTEAPTAGWGAKYGVAYPADITWFAAYAEGYPTVVFDMAMDDRDEKINFIKSVLTQPNIRLIGHNVTFDLRALGGHYGFLLPIGTQVWDTLSMSILLMMSDDTHESVALKSLLTRYQLIQPNTQEANDTNTVDTDEETDTEFLARMKHLRAILHTANREDVLRYVAMDAVFTFRLYELQRMIIQTTSDMLAEPFSDWGENGEWRISIRPSTKFSHTKNWSKLNELVEWEQRISRWSANAAIRGTKLNNDYVLQHTEQLLKEYSEAINTVLGITNEWGVDHISKIMWLVRYHDILIKMSEGKRAADVSKWVYWKPQSALNDTSIFKNSGSDEWIQYLMTYPMGTEPDSSLLELDPIRYIADLLWPDDANKLNRAQIAWNWFKHFYVQTKEIEPQKLVNKNLFQPFYVFCICEADFPTNEDIMRLPALATTELKQRVERDEDIDYVNIAHTTNAWSLCEDAQLFYLHKLCERSGIEIPERGEPVHPLMTPFIVASNHIAKLTRIDEFIRHAERDGRIHPIIARKTRTGRMSSTSMNLQNINMKDYRGYLTSNDDSHVLMGIDVSNAENYFAALTFADSQLAMACVSHDFHEQMARGYWGDELIDDLIANDHSAFKQLRKKGKFVTFGSAYGAGARKISRMVGCTTEEAQQLLANRDARFPAYAKGKRLVADRVERCYREGNRPAFTTLWSGRRIAVPTRVYNKRTVVHGQIVNETAIEVSSYKAVNYLQQGGVGELICRAQVMADEYFELNGVDAYIPLQVHDEIIVHAAIDCAFDAAAFVIRSISEVVPEEYRNRTIPAVRFLAALGPENAEKWGYNPLLNAYPLDKTKFVNQWGIWDMPENEIEAPTWTYNHNGGETIEEEIARRQTTTDDEAPQEQEQVDDATLKAVDKWEYFAQIFSPFMTTLDSLREYHKPALLVIKNQAKGPYLLSERMVIQQELAHRGQDPNGEYWKVLEQIQQLYGQAKEFVAWFERFNDAR